MLRKRTLLYLASGFYCPHYADLPYDRIILVDRHCAFKNKPKNKKVELIRADALTAIKQLKARSIKVDCLVSTNEGLIQGGGSYPIFSEFLLGYLSAILAEEFLLVMDTSYYSAIGIKTRVEKFDWGYKKVMTLQPGDSNYLYPSSFTFPYKKQENKEINGFGDVLLMHKINTKTAGYIGKVFVRVIHGSIFSAYNSIDLIGFTYPNIKSKCNRRYFHPFVSDFFYADEKIICIKDLSFAAIIAHCQNHKVKHLGLTPWLNGDYTSVINLLSETDFAYPKTISFYHLNRNDFGQLYTFLAKK